MPSRIPAVHRFRSSKTDAGSSNARHKSPHGLHCHSMHRAGKRYHPGPPGNALNERTQSPHALRRPAGAPKEAPHLLWDAMLDELVGIFNRGVSRIEKDKFPHFPPLKDFSIGAPRVRGTVPRQQHIGVKHGTEAIKPFRNALVNFLEHGKSLLLGQTCRLHGVAFGKGLVEQGSGF